jgi:hypothetical protein
MTDNLRAQWPKTLMIVSTVLGAAAGIIGAYYGAKAVWLTETQQRLAQTPPPPQQPSTNAPPSAPNGGVIINAPVTQTTHGPNSHSIIGNGNTIGTGK